MTTWWVHPVGESDLMLDNRGTEQERKERIDRSVRFLRTLLKAGDTGGLAGPVLDGVWDSFPRRSGTSEDALPENGQRPGTVPPLSAVLSLLSAEPGIGLGSVNLVLLGTRQPGDHSLDSFRTARVLEQALRQCALVRFPVLGSVRTVTVPGMGESNVLAALRPVLSGAETSDRGIVTAGSGATSLFMGAATALVRHGLPLWFAQVSPAGATRLIDSVERHDVDPVVSQLIRWRLFQPLTELLCKSDPKSPLASPEEEETVRKLALSQAAGYRAESVEDLLMLVEDGLVRRDCTTGLAVRRYVEVQYARMWQRDREHFVQEKPDATAPVNLWDLARNGNGKQQGTGKGKKNGKNRSKTLGAILKTVRTSLNSGEHPQNQGLDSTDWLLGCAVETLNEIGIASSHDLRAPKPQWLRKLTETAGERFAPLPERGFTADEGRSGERAMGRLPKPPRLPRTEAVVIYLVGRAQPGDTRPSMGRQVLDLGLGGSVRSHLDLDGENETEPVDVTVLLFHTPTSEEEARRQSTELRTKNPKSIGKVRPFPCLLPWNDDSGAVSQDMTVEEITHVKERITEHLREYFPEHAGSVVLFPPGNKQLLLPLMQVLRRETAFRGIPLFLREMGRGHRGKHLWPALTGGNAPMLIAARHSIESLELDVAWRLLAACGGCSDLENRCRRLIGAFVCRSIDELGLWPAIDDGQISEQQCRKETKNPITDTTLPPHTLSLAATRIQLIGEALSAVGRDGSPDHVIAQKIRCLVLAAAVVEKSVAMASPELQGQDAKKRYNNWLCEISAKSDDPRKADAATVLKMLNRSRNQTPITHGTFADPDTLVHDIAKKLLSPVQEPGPLTDGITDVATLLEAAVQAASILWPDRDPTVPDLPTYWHELLQDLKKEIEEIEKGA
jgi:hypothetical protein